MLTRKLKTPGGLLRALSTSATPQLKSKIAIIGSGPSAFYTAHSLLRHQPSLQVSIFEKLPTPFGLSRYGVAPDHAEVKACEEILEDLAAEGKVKFYGSVEVGKDVKLDELKRNFDSVVFAYGTSQEVTLGVKGEEEGHQRGNVLTSREFVDWYNGNPLRDVTKTPDLSKVEDVTVIGNGNVAMDIARLLLMPLDDLKATDIMNHAVVGLSQSKVKRVNIVARRGILESAFATKEIRELIQLEQHGVKFEGIEGQELDPIKIIVKKAERPLKRKVETVLNALKPVNERKLKYKASEKFDKFWNLQYLKSPVEFEYNDVGKIQITFVKNQLTMETPLGPVRVEPTDSHSAHVTDLVITSLGYKGTPLADFPSHHIQFSKGCIVNSNYKVVNEENQVIPGFYVTGWLNRASKGPILNQVASGADVAKTIINDLHNGVSLNPSEDFDDEGLSKWGDWVKLDSFEKELGKEGGKLRWKVPNVKLMKDVINGKAVKEEIKKR